MGVSLFLIKRLKENADNRLLIFSQMNGAGGISGKIYFNFYFLLFSDPFSHQIFFSIPTPNIFSNSDLIILRENQLSSSPKPKNWSFKIKALQIHFLPYKFFSFFCLNSINCSIGENHRSIFH